MKKRTINGYFAGIAFFALTAITLSSCGNNEKTEDPKDVAEEINDERFDDRKNEKDAQFLVEAATINMEEIALGKLAQTKGNMKEIRDLGKMMVMDHEKALNDLKGLAAQKSVELPAALPEDVQDAHDKLMEKSGADFDKEYASKMVKGHKDAIDKFEKASENAEDLDIRNWASSMIPSLQGHLEHSQKCEEMAKAAKK